MEPLGSLLTESPDEFLEKLEVKQTIRKAAAQRCPGCTFVCNMERNVMLGAVTRPATLVRMLRRRL